MFNGIGSKLVKTAAGTSGLRISNLFLLFASNVLVTRLLGVEGYGVYAFSMSWVLLLNILATLGSQRLVVREISANLEKKQWAIIHGILYWTNKIVLCSSVVIVIVVGAIAFGLRANAHGQTLATLWIALLLIPIMALTTLRQSAMQGFRHIIQGQLPAHILQPVFFILFLGGAHVLGLNGLDAPRVMTLRVVSGAIAFMMGAILFFRVIPSPVKQSVPEYMPNKWLPSMMSMLFMAGAATLFTRSDAVMLGMLKGTAEVGIYTVALRGTRYILMGLQIGATVLGPNVAELYAKGDIDGLQTLTTKSVRIIMAYALPVGVGLLLFGSWFLKLFGSEFVQGKTVLAILCVGQLVNAATGSVSLLLIMTHHERDNAVVTGVSASLNGLLNLLLIPRLGAEGAAIATTCTILISNVWLACLVYRRLGIHCTIFGKIPLTLLRS